MKIVMLDRATLGVDIPTDALRQLGKLTVYESTSPQQMKERVEDADVLVLNKVKMDAEAFMLAKNLKLVCVLATGYDNIDLAEARKHGVAVTNVPGYSTDSVALITLATVLSLASHLREYNEYVTDGRYGSSGIANRITPVYHEIRGLTWGIIGYGNIGKAVGKIAESMGARVVVNKLHPTEDGKCVDLETLLRVSDIITIHCPLTKETAGIIDANAISLMKDGVILVNEARGAVLNSEDVAHAVESGKISAFGTDVYESEPISPEHPFNRIMHRKNVLLTPHCAWGAYEARLRCLNTVADNIKAFVERKIQNRVDIIGQ